MFREVAAIVDDLRRYGARDSRAASGQIARIVTNLQRRLSTAPCELRMV
jgi:hypothetical protein